MTKMLTDVIMLTDVKMKILKDLNKWMMENDKTVRETADMLDIHYVTLSRLLHGKNIPYDRTAYKIKEFLKKQKIK